MASWLQSKLKAAEGLLEAVDRTAKVTREHHVSGTGAGSGAAAAVGAVSQLWNLGAYEQDPDSRVNGAGSSSPGELTAKATAGNKATPCENAIRE